MCPPPFPIFQAFQAPLLEYIKGRDAKAQLSATTCLSENHVEKSRSFKCCVPTPGSPYNAAEGFRIDVVYGKLTDIILTHLSLIRVSDLIQEVAFIVLSDTTGVFLLRRKTFKPECLDELGAVVVVLFFSMVERRSHLGKATKGWGNASQNNPHENINQPRMKPFGRQLQFSERVVRIQHCPPNSCIAWKLTNEVV